MRKLFHPIFVVLVVSSSPGFCSLFHSFPVVVIVVNVLVVIVVIVFVSSYPGFQFYTFLSKLTLFKDEFHFKATKKV